MSSVDLLMDAAMANIQVAAPRLAAVADNASATAARLAPEAAEAASTSAGRANTAPRSTPELLTAEAYRQNEKNYKEAYYSAARRFKKEYSGNSDEMSMVLGFSNPREGGVPANLNTANDFFGYMEEVAREVGNGNIYRRSSVDASNPRLQRAGVDPGLGQGRLGLVDVFSSKAALNALDESEAQQAMVLREAFGYSEESGTNEEIRRLAIGEIMGEEYDPLLRSVLSDEATTDAQKVAIHKAEADMLDKKLGMTYENEAGEIVQNPYAAANARKALGLEEPSSGPERKALEYLTDLEDREIYDPVGIDVRVVSQRRPVEAKPTASEIMEKALNDFGKKEPLGFVGRYAPQRKEAMVESAIPGLGSIEAGGAMGMFQTAMLGGAMGGALSVATGGEFGEGAVAGGIAGLGIRGVVGAIRANGASLEKAMYRSVLGEDFKKGMTYREGVAALRATNDDNLSFVQNQAKSMLLSDRPSMTQQSRGAIMGGAALSGMMFTSNKKDHRRGFNKHRGNRI